MFRQPLPRFFQAGGIFSGIIHSSTVAGNARLGQLSFHKLAIRVGHQGGPIQPFVQSYETSSFFEQSLCGFLTVSFLVCLLHPLFASPLLAGPLPARARGTRRLPAARRPIGSRAPDAAGCLWALSVADGQNFAYGVALCVHFCASCSTILALSCWIIWIICLKVVEVCVTFPWQFGHSPSSPLRWAAACWAPAWWPPPDEVRVGVRALRLEHGSNRLPPEAPWKVSGAESVGAESETFHGIAWGGNMELAATCARPLGFRALRLCSLSGVEGRCGCSVGSGNHRTSQER